MGNTKLAAMTKKNNSSINSASKEILWQGAPNQNFKLWNSKESRETLLTTGYILLACGILFLLAFVIVSLYFWFTHVQGESTFVTATQLWACLSVPLLLFLVFMDIRDFIFRKGNKYCISNEGITFTVGNFKKNDFLLKWENIEEIKPDEEELLLLIIPKEKIDFHTNTPNTTEQEVPYIEAKSKWELTDLQKLIKPILRKSKRKKKTKKRKS